MNENRRAPRHADPELIELFNALTGPQLMGLEPEEKAALYLVGAEATFQAEGKSTLFDAREKVLVITEGSDDMIEVQTSTLALSLIDITNTSHIGMSDIRSCGLQGFLKDTMEDLRDRKKKLPENPSRGMMIFGFVSAVLLAAGILFLFLHPGVSAWFNEKAAGVVLTILAIVVTVAVLVATGSFIGGGVGFLVFALVTWLLNQLIPLHIILKVLVTILLGLGALIMFYVGKNEVDAIRDGNEQKRAELLRPLRQDIENCREYILLLKNKAERAKKYAAAKHTGEARDLMTRACEAVVFYYTFAEEQLNELSGSLAKD
ncbi:MAG: hypothetical protein IKM31_10795 [Oscillospiraceae bacterium]|nr:hypothetical protein [Oscillospiraceae bacterium]